MIKLSEKLTKYVNKVQKLNNVEFTNEDLCNVTKLVLSKEDIPSIRHFENLESIEFSSFPSITQSELDEVAAMNPKIQELIIKDQSALVNLDLEMFFYLRKLTIISNDNISYIYDLDKLSKLEEVVIYDNKNLNIDNLYDFIANSNIKFNIDLIYYHSFVNSLIDENKDISDTLYDRVQFVDCYGYRKTHVKVLKKEDLFSLLDNINDIVSLYCFDNDTDIKKFYKIHQWMMKNITYINEDVEENLDYYGVVDAFVDLKAGRLSYARTFQLLLLFVGIKTDLVYSTGATELIGKYTDIDLVSFQGDGDYALVKCLIDEKYYYTDIAWNRFTTENNCYSDLKLLLLSKEDISLKHKLVGEGIVEKSATYNPKLLEDVISEVENNIQDVDYLLKDINLSDENVSNSKELFGENNKEIDELKERISQEEVGTELYNKLVEELVSLEKVINSYNKILVKYTDSQKELIEKYSFFIMSNYLLVNDITKVSSDIRRKLELRRNYKIISQYLYDLLITLLNINFIK